jgi:aminoglycoside phosphotransferase (APT) family kinase protein
MPTERYPWPWSVYPWFEGEDAITAHMELGDLARDLGRFIRSLEAIDPTGGPEPSRANFGRGVPLAMRDAMTRDAIRAAGGLVDTDAVTEAWEDALRAPAWDRPPVWIPHAISSLRGNCSTVTHVRSCALSSARTTPCGPEAAGGRCPPR